MCVFHLCFCNTNVGKRYIWCPLSRMDICGAIYPSAVCVIEIVIKVNDGQLRQRDKELINFTGF